MKVGSAASSDQQRVTGERDPGRGQDEGHATVRVAGSGARFQRMTAEGQVGAVGKLQVGCVKRNGLFRSDYLIIMFMAIN